MNGFTKLAFILAFFSTSPAGAISYLGAGAPGCLKLILERPMAERVAMKLESNCKDLRSAYLASLNLYSKNPAKFEKEITQALKANQTPEPAYRAILMAAIFDDVKLIPALQLRAKIEQAKKVRYQYAVAALERVKTGVCSKSFSDPAYDEVCRLSSPVVQRIIELSGSVQGATR